MDVLLVLEQRAMQRRNERLAIRALERLGRDVFGEQQLEPIQQLGSRRLLLETGNLAQIEEDLERLLQQRLFEAGKMHVDDLRHRVPVGEPDVVEETAPQEGVRQFLLIVRRDDDQRTVERDDRPLRFINVELHAVELAEQIVGELDVGLVDFVNQYHGGRRTLERIPQHAALDVVRDVADAAVTELRIAQSRHGIVFVETLLRLGRRFDVPLEQGAIERAGHRFGEQRLAGAGLAFDEQRPLERQRRIDGELQ